MWTRDRLVSLPQNHAIAWTSHWSSDHWSELVSLENVPIDFYRSSNSHVDVDVNVVHVDVAVHDVAGRQHRRRCRRIDSVFGTKLFGLFLAFFVFGQKPKMPLLLLLLRVLVSAEDENSRANKFLILEEEGCRHLRWSDWFQFWSDEKIITAVPGSLGWSYMIRIQLPVIGTGWV